jgi:PAS domain S-box-containing protein
MARSDAGARDVTVLVVTADQEFATACERNLPPDAAFQITTAGSVGEAIDILGSSADVDCIISDHDLPDTDGVAFLEVVRAQTPTMPFILFTSEGSEAAASRAISADVTEYLIKEHHSDQWERLARLVEDAVEYYRTHGSVVNTETRAKTLLDAAHDMIAVVRGGRLDYVNQAGIDLLRVDGRDAVVGRPIGELLTLPTEESTTEQLAAIQTGDRLLERIEAQLVCADDHLLPVEVTATHVEWLDVPATALIVRDISERKEYQSDLELKERAMDEAPIGITIADATEPDNPLIYVNDEFERLTGYPKGEALGRNCRFLQSDGTDPEPVATMREQIDAEEPVTVELRNYRKDGTEFWNRVTIAPVENEDGEVTHYVGFQEDVTDRKEDERMLRRFSEAVEAAGHAIYITDSDGTIEYVNPAFERITGYSAVEAVGRNPRILKSGEMPDDFYEDLWETLLAGEIWEEEIVNSRSDGDLYHAHQTIAPVTSDDGDVEGFVAIQTDITDQKEYEAQLRQYEHAIEGASELISAVDEDYRFLFTNPAFREFYGIEREDLTDTRLPEIIGEDAFETARPYVEEALDGNSVQYRMTRSRADRPDRIFDIRYYPLADDSDGVQGVVATLQDRTEQVERETQLASLDRMLRHNLRNDLNAVLGRAELIAEREAGETESDARTIERLSERILTQAEKEREIVELLTDPSPPVPHDLPEMVTAAVSRIETAHPDATISVDLPETLEVRTIPELERAIEEVIENAIVHTDREPAEVSITVTDSDETVELRVTDDGPGIPSQERKVISDDEAVEPLVHSGGMGLWLVKRIITRAGGTIQFEDATPNGSVVSLIIPQN